MHNSWIYDGNTVIRVVSYETIGSEGNLRRRLYITVIDGVYHYETVTA